MTKIGLLKNVEKPITYDQIWSGEKGRKTASPMIAVANPKNCKDGTSSCGRNDGWIMMAIRTIIAIMAMMAKNRMQLCQ